VQCEISLLAVVYNFKSQEARLVYLTPSDSWGGAGLLGVTIRLDNYAGAEDRLVRVLSVEPGSPAAIAGLVAETDFLLGTTHQSLESVNHFAAVLSQNVDSVVELYVYNSDTDIVRVVALMPTYQWGEGLGLLGAEVGTGYLHRLPFKSRATEGSCVERKVRYVKGPTSNVLENEPQLEMEPDDEVESVNLETPEKTVVRKFEPAAKSSETPQRSTAVDVAPNPEVIPTAESPLQTPVQRSITRAPSSLGAPRAPSSFGLDPKEVQAVFEQPPPSTENTPTSGVTAQEPHVQPQHHGVDQHNAAGTPGVPQSPYPQHHSIPVVQQQEQPLYYAQSHSAPPQSFAPPPVNTAYQNGAGSSKPALSPLGPPPQLYYGTNVTRSSSVSSYSAAAPYQQQQPQYTPPSYMSAAPLPPPPVGYHSQQPRVYHAANQPPQYSSSS
jgi:GRASP55/65 PDZ-like domain